MAGTTPPRSLLLHSGLSLALYGGIYTTTDDGELYHCGSRPGPEWHRHGTCLRRLFVFTAKGIERVTIRKQRWKRRKGVPGLPRTCHSRPPDDLPQVWSCATVVLLALWCWLDADKGLHTYESPIEELADFPSPRTLQRWMKRARLLGEQTQQALRRALIERCEPRPLELLFRGGVPPPHRGRMRAWSRPKVVWRLANGLALAVHGSTELHITIPRLMAEARGRWHPPGLPFLI